MTYVDTAKYTPTILSLCPGIRGIERGLERVFPAIRVAAYVEIETFIIENLLAAMEAGLVDAAPIWTNLKTLNPEPFRGRIDGIIGGYPCQPFSVAGNRNGTEDPRHLWPYIANCIRAIRPVWCFFENVRGHLTCGYETVRRELQDMGYTVREGIYSAEEVGAPHRRERLFILAVMADTKSVDWRLSESERRKQAADTSGISKMLANSNSKYRRFEQQFGVSEIPGAWNKPDRSCQTDLANTCGEGLQGDEPRGVRGEREELSGSIAECGTESRWPARPGEQQYDWEEPRTVESGMGCTVNGYNFREDLLRAFGNSVVEQTSELAFRDLIRKHSYG